MKNPLKLSLIPNIKKKRFFKDNNVIFRNNFYYENRIFKLFFQNKTKKKNMYTEVKIINT